MLALTDPTTVHDVPQNQVVAYLDELVRSFDVLRERFGSEKIKIKVTAISGPLDSIAY